MPWKIAIFPTNTIINDALHTHDPRAPRPVALFVNFGPIFEISCIPPEYHHVRGGRYGLAGLLRALLDGGDPFEQALSHAWDGAARG
jgi:hypothetical protein